MNANGHATRLSLAKVHRAHAKRKWTHSVETETVTDALAQRCRDGALAEKTDAQ